MARGLADQTRIFLSTLPASPRERRLALRVVLGFVALFLTLAPFARVPLGAVPAFIPIYESALVIINLITAGLLFGQFSFLGSRALLVLASGFLFTAFITVAHALTFPDLFAPGGLLGAGPQTTAWLYMFWHGGFPLFVLAYALLKDETPEALRSRARVAIVGCTAAMLALVCALTSLAADDPGWLPVIMRGNGYASAMTSVVGAVWLLSLLALVVLWRRRPHTVLDVWLLVVMSVWLFDVALSAIMNAGRYDLGFYAGRIYGLIAASFVLMVLLIESSMLYARLARAHALERRERKRVQQRSAELVAANQELESFSYSVSHDLRAPLRAIAGYAAIIEEDHARGLDEEGRRLLGMVRQRSRNMDALIDDLLAFSRLGRQSISAARVDMNALVADIVRELQAGEGGERTEFEMAALPAAWGDRALLRQLWVNLLSNAVKFSRASAQPKVEIGYSQRSAQAVYWVRDNGAGFDMEYYDKLFAAFQRLHSTREFPGSGVGLAIVERIVTRHDGHVWADSKPGGGATFFFTLKPEPLADAAA